MLLSNALNAAGLILDIIGFFILFVLAFPAVMRRDFVTSDRAGIDGVQVESRHVEQLMDPEKANLLRQQRRRRQMFCYVGAGTMILLGYLLQLVALFVSQ